MYPTTEVRWFTKGELPAEVRSWFFHREPAPVPQAARVDHYLKSGSDRTMGVKRREGRIEIKARTQLHGEHQWRAEVSGVVQSWAKWSFPIQEGEHATPDPSAWPAYWIAVWKQRWLCFYQRDDELVTPIDKMPEIHGCGLELAQIEVRGANWWSLGVEAFGDEGGNYERLKLTCEHVFSIGQPPPLEAGNSFSYPSWLRAIT